MMYKITITETVRKIEYVEANDKYGALKEAERMYDNGEIDMSKEVEISTSFDCLRCEDENAAARVIVEVRGGLVQNVYSSDPSINIEVADFDNYGRDEEDEDGADERLDELESEMKNPDMHIIY